MLFRRRMSSIPAAPRASTVCSWKTTQRRPVIWFRRRFDHAKL